MRGKRNALYLIGLILCFQSFSSNSSDATCILTIGDSTQIEKKLRFGVSLRLELPSHPESEIMRFAGNKSVKFPFSNGVGLEAKLNYDFVEFGGYFEHSVYGNRFWYSDFGGYAISQYWHYFQFGNHLRIRPLKFKKHELWLNVNWQKYLFRKYFTSTIYEDLGTEEYYNCTECLESVLSVEYKFGIGFGFDYRYNFNQKFSLGTGLEWRFVGFDEYVDWLGEMRREFGWSMSPVLTVGYLF